MRHCVNDYVEVYEAENKLLGPLLSEIAEWLNENHEDGTWTNLHVSSTQEDDGSPLYRATLYVH